MQSLSLLIIVVFTVGYVHSFSFKNQVKSKIVLKNVKNSELIVTKSLLFTSLLTPLATIADETGVADRMSSFSLPLIISFATMIPFVAYLQALKPKPRTVKQIELDSLLRPKDKTLMTGKTGEARTSKKK